MKYFALIITLLFLSPVAAIAAERLSITPAVIDEKALARDIIRHTITVTNTTSAKMDVYAIVNNVDTTSGKQDFKNRADVELKDSLANWIQISRGAVELAPGESHEFPMTINVNLNAEPGDYHALISFMWGGSRAYAEANVKRGVSTAVNVEVYENVKERLQLGSFTSKELFFTTPEVKFTYDLENIGNKDLVPSGEVRIYDRKGKEVGAIPANVEQTSISPNEVGQIASAWTAAGKFGRYKALLDIEYGSQLGTVNDTIYFWIVPWKTIVGLFLVLAVGVGGTTYVWWGRLERARQPEYVRARARRQYARQTGSLFVNGDVPQEFVTPAPSDAHVMDMRD